MQKLLCIEEENVALNELLVKFTRSLIKTYSKTKSVQLHCTNYEELQDNAERMQRDLDRFYETSIIQQAGAVVSFSCSIFESFSMICPIVFHVCPIGYLEVNNARQVSAELKYFPVKWKGLDPPAIEQVVV